MINWEYTFSNSSLMGGGLLLVTASAISLPIANAASRDLPFNNTNTESVSPYNTRAFHLRQAQTVKKDMPSCISSSA